MKTTPRTPSTHRRVPRALALGTVISAVLVAGCGSSSSSSTSGIGVGVENPHALAELEKVEHKESTSTTTSSTSSAAESSTKEVSTPKSGPLSKEPKVTPPSGSPPSKTETKEIVEGKGAEAKVGDKITVNYVGALYKSGKTFEATWERGTPASFTLKSGPGGVIEGWVKGIAGMKVGGRRELVIPASEAYGKEGSGSIPPNSALVFVVDLLEV